jgi:superkiller protein 3
MSKKIDEYHKEALNLFVKKEYNQAIDFYKKIYDLDKKNYQAIYNLGVISFTKKKYLQSSKYFRKAFELNQSSQYLSSLIESYLFSEKIEEAEKIYDEFNSIIDEENKNKITINLKKFIEFNEIKQERDNINKLLKKQKNDTEKGLNFSDGDSINQKINTLKSRLEKSINLHEEEPFLLSIYAQLLTIIKEDIKSIKISYEEIISLYEKSLKIKIDDIEVIINLGIIYKRNGQIQKSIDILNSAKKIFSDDYLIFYNCANSYIELNHFKEAEKDLLKTIDLNPSFISAYLNLAKLYKENNDLNNSESYYKKIIEINTNHPAGYRGLAAIKLIKLEYKEAFEYLTKALEFDPDHEGTKQNLSIYYYRIGETNKAVELSKSTAGVIVFKNSNNIEPYEVKN